MKHEAQSVPEARAMVDSDQSTCFHWKMLSDILAER